MTTREIVAWAVRNDVTDLGEIVDKARSEATRDAATFVVHSVHTLGDRRQLARELIDQAQGILG